MGISFVSLTTAGLAGVAPADAGAASGLINVMQQLGAALGLAVLVTVFDGTVGSGLSGRLGRAADTAVRGALVHGLDVAFGAGAIFALCALAIVIFGVRPEAERQTQAQVDEENEPSFSTEVGAAA